MKLWVISILLEIMGIYLEIPSFEMVFSLGPVDNLLNHTPYCGDDL